MGANPFLSVVGVLGSAIKRHDNLKGATSGGRFSNKVEVVF